MMATSDSLEVSLLEDLKCPVCDNYMCPPIRQCIKGHSICDNCFPKIRNCPLCRAPKSQARCYTLENIQSKLSIPCRYSRAGCRYISVGSTVQTHEKYCKLSPWTCPFRTYYNCQWRDVQGKLLSHLKKRHDSNFYDSEKQTFFCENFENITETVYYYIILYAYRQFFRLSWDIDLESGLTKWAVYFIGRPNLAKRYSYKIEFIPDDVTIGTSISFKAPCSPVQDDDSIKFIDHNYLTVHYDTVKKYCDGNGGLNYKVTIYNDTQQIALDEDFFESLLTLSVVNNVSD